MSDTILDLARLAAAWGWGFLGRLPLDAFREADALLHEGYYYVFTTEMTAGGAPGTTWNILSTQFDTPSDGLTTVTLTTPHGLALGTRQYALSFVGTGVAGLSGPKFCTCPTTTTLQVFQNTTTNGSAGTVSYSVASPFVAMRRATTLEGIAATVYPEYRSRIAASIYYPSVLVEGSGASAVWHMFGYNSTGAGTRHQTYTGLFPTSTPPAVAFLSGADINVRLGDISVRKHPTNGYWYAVGNTDDPGELTALYRNDDINDNAGWEEVAADIWAAGDPAWGGSLHPDPNIAFMDGVCYLTVTMGSVSGEWSTGITTLDVTTGVASVANAVMLQQYGSYNEWQNEHVLSDLILHTGADSVKRIVAFCNANLGTEAVEGEAWGVLELFETRGGYGELMIERSGGSIELRVERSGGSIELLITEGG